MPYTILIMGLPGSGKTTLASKLFQTLNERNISVSWYNADQIREQHNDWDFSEVGRLRQAHRMRDIADYATTDFVIIDIVAPLQEMRDIINPDFVVWTDTISSSRYSDTDLIFKSPSKFNIQVTEKNCNKWSKIILKKLHELHNI